MFRPVLLHEVIEFMCSRYGHRCAFLEVCFCNRSSYPSSSSGHNRNFAIYLAYFRSLCALFSSLFSMLFRETVIHRFPPDSWLLTKAYNLECTPGQEG